MLRVVGTQGGEDDNRRSALRMMKMVVEEEEERGERRLNKYISCSQRGGQMRGRGRE